MVVEHNVREKRSQTECPARDNNVLMIHELREKEDKNKKVVIICDTQLE